MNHTNDYARRLAAFARVDQPRNEVPLATIENGVAEIRLYDPIDSWGEWWGVSAKEFASTLDGLGDVNEIRLLINSPGGEVFEGIAIANTIRNHPAKVTAIVEGLAASAASFIAVAADELIMARNSELMIHDAWGLVVGNSEDMTKMAGLLDHLSDNIADIYAAKAGGTVADWRAAMKAETWYSASEAVDAGLADRVAEDVKPKASAHDLSIFTYAGRAAAPAPGEHPPAEMVTLNDEIAAALAGVDAIVSGAERVAALRAEAGKSLSDVNRESLDGLRSRLNALLDGSDVETPVPVVDPEIEARRLAAAQRDAAFRSSLPVL